MEFIMKIVLTMAGKILLRNTSKGLYKEFRIKQRAKKQPVRKNESFRS